MKQEEYISYKAAFCKAFDAKRTESVLEISENELRPCIGKIPDSFFRYRRITAYTDDEIIKGNVHLNNPGSYDDIFDSKCYIDKNGIGDAIVTNYLNSISIAENVPEYIDVVEEQDKYFQSVNKKIDERLRIACFTQKKDNVPMWYYYADKHKGICIEYDFSKLKSFVDLEYIFLPIIYPNKDETNNYRTGIFIQDTFDVSAVRNSLVKSNDWKFEKEWRIINLDGITDILLPVKRVYLGYDIDEADKKHIIELVDKSALNISICEMKESVIGLKAKKIK